MSSDRYHRWIADVADPAPGAPVSTLRGAAVAVDARRTARVLIGLVAVALAVSSVAVFVAGVRGNDRITRLRRDGVPVELRVESCVGLLGGSGSNAAGYRCRVSYRLDGRSYQEALPGSVLYGTGTVIRGLAVPGDPGLVSTRALVAAQRPSDGLYLLAAALLAALLLLVGGLLYRRAQPPGRRRPLGRDRAAGGV